MSHVTAVEKLLRQGRFAEALNRLDSSSIAAEDRLVADGLRVELLERIGRSGQSTALAEQLFEDGLGVDPHNGRRQRWRSATVRSNRVSLTPQLIIFNGRLEWRKAQAICEQCARASSG